MLGRTGARAGATSAHRRQRDGSGVGLMASATAGERRVVLIRGINVGGRRKLPMAVLREACEAAGCRNVTTYIQSGNVVLDSTLPPTELGTRLEAAIGQAVGFSPRVIVRTGDELRHVVASNPFTDADEATLHVGFMDAEPSAAAVASLPREGYAPERWELRGLELYLHLPTGLGRSQLMALPLERRLGVAVTVRNWRTLRRLHDLAAV